MVCPVTQLAASDARKTARFATSSGVPMRPEGIDATVVVLSDEQWQLHHIGGNFDADTQGT